MKHICPKCGGPKSDKKTAQCWECSKQSRSQKLKGVKHTDERRRKNSESQKARNTRFDLAAYMRDKPHPFALPAGTERIVKDGRVQVKCEDGKWRYRSRLMWQAAYGPISSEQIVHHVNSNPMDDRLDNFQLVTRAEHMRIHHHR